MVGSALPASVVAELVAAARGYLRAGEGEAALLTRLSEAAIGLCEQFCGVAVVQRGFEEEVTAGSGWQGLRARPATAIVGVASTGDGVALAVGGYLVDIDAGGDGWVRVAAGVSRVTVGYTAGLAASWAAVPAPLAQGCAMLVAHLFEHREGNAMPPAAVAALWRPFRVMRLAAGPLRPVGAFA